MSYHNRIIAGRTPAPLLLTYTPRLDCGHYPSPHGPHTTGYGVTQDGRKHCYDCCAAADFEQMDRTGRIVLYDVMREGRREVSNWPGSLRFNVFHAHKGRHNMAGWRYDVWFTDRRGNVWHGVRYGDNTELCHCRRLAGQRARSSGR